MTDNQARVLTLIRDSEYHDGEDPVDHQVWTEVVMDAFGGNSKLFLGVLVSLQNAGYVGTLAGQGRVGDVGDGTVWITPAGLEAIEAWEES